MSNKVHPGTGNQIAGWQYDKRRWPSSDNDYTTNVPSLTNADLSGIDSSNYQSGVGPNDQCKVLSLLDLLSIGFTNRRIPVVKNGFWYDHEKEYYLYSDYIHSQYALAGNVTSGCNYVDLVEYPKEGVPILGRIYLWDSINEEYLIYKNYERKLHLSGTKPTPTSNRLSTWDNNSKQVIFANIDSSLDEFTVIYDGFTLPRILFNKAVGIVVGNNVSVGNDLLTLELVGTADGTDKNLFNTKYSPLDKTQSIEVFTYTTNINSYQQWTTRLNTSLVHTGHECIIDTDLGTVQFGSVSDGDVIPPANAKVLIRYTATAEITYESNDSNMHLTAYNKKADVNPISHTNNRGFLIIKRQEDKIFNIALACDAPLISPDVYGPVDIGSILTKLTATVTKKNGNPIENTNVVFTILDTPITGNFTNGTGSINTYTNHLGKAIAYYNPPNSIDQISEIIPLSQFSTSGGNTILTTTSMKVSSSMNETFLYSVWKDDPFQGIDIGDQATLDSGLLTTELSDFYKQFFIDNEIFGPTGIDPDTGEPSGLLQSGASWWENRRRLFSYILTPVSYNRALRNGRKQIVATWSSSALDPHFHETGAFIPLAPTSVVNVGTAVQNDIHYNGVTLTAPGTGDLDSYMVISTANLTIQASAYDEFLDKIIYSNIITIELKIPDALNGTYNITDINSVPPNTVPYILNTGDNGKILPLGFKVRQTGNTLASAIQAVTYIDINQPASINLTFNVDIIQ
jgi:hypothetical protein